MLLLLWLLAGARSGPFDLSVTAAQSGNVRGKCVLLRLEELTRETLDELVANEAGAIVVLLPTTALDAEVSMVV